MAGHGRDNFHPVAAVPEWSATSAVCRALGLDTEPQGLVEGLPAVRFRSAREIEDNDYGKCVELGFDLTSQYFQGKLVIRHAERYRYAPVHARTDGLHGPRDGSKPGPKPYADELTAVRYATVK